MSRLFSVYLELTLNFALAIGVFIVISSSANAQNVNLDDKVNELSQLIAQVENYQQNLGSTDISQTKVFIDQIKNEADNSIDLSLANEIIDAHIEYMKHLIIEAQSGIKISDLENNIEMEKQLRENIEKYNTEISDDLKKYR